MIVIISFSEKKTNIICISFLLTKSCNIYCTFYLYTFISFCGPYRAHTVSAVKKLPFLFVADNLITVAS